LPTPLPLLPPTAETLLGIVSQVPDPQPAPSAGFSGVSTKIRSPRNIFGLFRQYNSDKTPSHDPEENVNLQDLCDEPVAAGPTVPRLEPVGDFYPYPNRNSFRLGDWYWNHGAQKSRESFHKLLHIVGDPEFHPDDVRHTPWGKIDKKLAWNDFDNENSEDEHDAEWVDEDAGWKKSLVKISVPFNTRAE
jgi:hypothetical protein